MRKVRYLSSLMGAIALVSMLGIVGAGLAFINSVTHAASSDVISSGVLKQDDGNTYWTASRRKSAKPWDMPLKSSGAHRDPAESTPASQGPVAPKNYANWSVLATVGKIFFTDSKTGDGYVCSGTAIVSKNQSVVDTAGHCVIEGGSKNNWYTHWQFCPQYNNGPSQYGCWSARTLWTRADWANSASQEDDFGEAVIYPNSLHQHLTSVVGGAGWAYNQPVPQTVTAYGYSAEGSFNGQTMQTCSGTSVSSSLDDGTVVTIPCTQMTGGASGGPWFISLNGKPGYVNGHNDYVDNRNAPATVTSPYYDSDWYAVYNAAQNA